MIDLIQRIDSSLIHTLQSIGPALVLPARFFSALVYSAWFFVPVVTLVLFAKGKKGESIRFLSLCLLAVLLVLGLKAVIDAPRPSTVDSSVIAYVVESGSGMPSGHALASIVILGWVWLRGSRGMRLLACISTLVLLIGLSRVYLGVHYPSQVIAGWAIGVVILWVFSRLSFSVSSSSRSSSVDSR